MGAEFKHIALVDTENKKFQLWGTEVGGIEKRISLLEENSKVFSSILNRKTLVSGKNPDGFIKFNNSK